MNQEEEIPTRVTRGALRRRSIDQDATPQNPQATGTSVAGGTPKKAASAAKKPSTLGAIQEGQGRPSTPVGGGRGTRRRMSETSDTPTTAPNKQVQSLKDAEGSGTGRRSRNTSLTLTEENVQELNAANEGTGAVTVRTRTPARLRASHETLTGGSPQTAPAAVRRSTRRNSVTSDDGSVQSLPVTGPKTPIGRSVKVEPIVEEDIAGSDRAGLDSSVQSISSRSSPRAVSQSPRPEVPSPLSATKAEMTPPRGSVSPQQSSSVRKTPGSASRSKNVSFTDDSKREDHQSGYPKTPTSPGKKFVLVGLNDLRNTPLINGSPKENAVIVLSSGKEKAGNARSANVSPKAAENDVPGATAEAEGKEKPNTETLAPSPSENTENVSAATRADSAVPLNISSSIPPADRSVVAAPNDVSGVEALESSVLEDVVNTSNASSGQKTEGESFSKYWSHSVRGTPTKGIDAFSVRKQEEKQTEEEQKKLDASLQRGSKTPETKKTPKKAESEEEEEEEAPGHPFGDDEAMEVDGYESGDSLDAEIRQEMAANEIEDQGEDLGTDDTEEDGENGEQEDENDSFIVTDDEEELLAGTGDDLSTDDSSPVKTPKEKTPSKSRRRIIEIVDDSEEEEEEKEKATKPTTPSSKERSTTERKRSVKQLTTTDEEASPEKRPNRSVMTEDDEEKEDDQKRKVEKLDSTLDKSKEATGPAKQRKTSETATPSKAAAANASVKTVPKSPAPSVHDSESSYIEVFLDEKTDVSGASAAKEAQESKAAERDGASSRMSLPSVASSKESGKAVARKSLPAGTKMQFVEEVTTEELHPSMSNLEESYQEEEEEEQIANEKQQKDKNDTSQDVTQNGVDQAASEKVSETAKLVTSDEEEYFEASEIVDEMSQHKQKRVEDKQTAAREKAEAATEEHSVAPVKPARKTLPVAASLISAQFYLGGAKKEKRNTPADAEGEEASMVATSTPNPKQSAKKSKKTAAAAAVSSNLVANPFALASAKAKARLSMDSAVADGRKAGELDVSVQKVKKTRNSLPVMTLDVAGGAESKNVDCPSVEEEEEEKAEVSPQLDEPEPMEVDEYVAEDEEEQTENGGGDGAGGADKQPEQKGATVVEGKPKTPKKKPKALTEFDLESILTRCNEVVRADKERKKQFATLAQQKRDEKRRLRELREREEKLESAEGTHDDTKPSITTSANEEEESVEQPASDDPAKQKKKKKKRKTKVKNFILEELAELKKDRVSEALLRKMEAIEARKQRKKERRAEKMKLLNKENGGVRAGAPDGIGAKLEKVAKKKQKQRKETAAAEEERKKQQPASVRVAVSAFAVFQQLQNGQTSLQPAELKADGGDGKKHTTKVSEVERSEAKKKVTQPDEPKKSPEEKKPNSKMLVAKTPTADDVFAPKNKKKAEGKQLATAEVQKAASESQLGRREMAVSAEKPIKRKQKKAEVAAAAEVVAVPEAIPLPQEEKRNKEKKKKNKIEKMADSMQEGGSKREAPREKKRVPAAEFFVVPEAEPLPREETSKPKKLKKHKADKLVLPVEEDVQKLVEPLPAKETRKVNRKEIEKKNKKKLGTGKPKDDGESLVASALREIQAVFDDAKRNKKAPKDKKGKKKQTDDGSQDHAVVVAVDPSAKKRKRDPADGSSTSSTPRPTKLRALQRVDLGFVEETVTPDKTRLQRNFGFEEVQATPKAVGFKVSSLLPTDELRTLVHDSTKAGGKRKQLKKKGMVPEPPNRVLPLPVWTRSGYFLEVPDKESERPKKKSAHGEGKKHTNATAGAGVAASSYIPLKGHERAGFKLKTLRDMPNAGGVSSSSSAAAPKPHRISPDTIAPSVVSFKRQQLLEKTAHLREKKKGGGRM